MKAPVATYRVQLNQAFGFSELKKIIPYLSGLGISHIYASPIFQAKSGSMHGYDITDPNKINEELGGAVEFESLIREASAHGIEWLQDIVPNHASYSVENQMVYDVLQKGAGSGYSAYFDVNWNHPSIKLKGKILAPFLSEPYAQALKKGKLSLTSKDGFKIKYADFEFPLNAKAKKKLGSLSQKTIELYKTDPEFLDKLLSAQFYKLAYWKTALSHINYRRFFDIIGLIGLRTEDPTVFAAIHQLILKLVASGSFSGLRVDHIDGLLKPEKYLKTLRQNAPDAYVLVEKILTGDEQLSRSWPVQGTTGYDYLNYANQVFIKSKSEPEVDTFYKQFSGHKEAFSDLLYECKKNVAKSYFLGDAANLAWLFYQTLRKLNYRKPFSCRPLRDAIIELLACFPIYRTYKGEQRDNDVFMLALDLARQRNTGLSDDFSAICYLLEQSGVSEEALAAIMRFQQFTGAVIAKGFEDTALYRYNRLLSLNEVGGSPQCFGISTEGFHKFNMSRQQNWPLTLNASSTHDTKRGEDIRARLNVLSELPSEFRANLEEWVKVNAAKKTVFNGKPVPDRNEEYYLYQTLLGAYPWVLNEKQGFTERIKLHMVKALREAKINTNWIEPNLPYEEAAISFVAEILCIPCFLESFLSFQRKIAWYGFYNTLAQTLLKITCPGVPDFYQGSELWDLNLVDPDNRRLVDYQKRQNLLAEISKIEPKEASNLLENPADAKAKLYVIYRALQLRRKLKPLFEEGAYIPLAAKGKRVVNVIAFARQKGDAYVVVVVPRFFASLLTPNCVWGGSQIQWDDTYLPLPENAPIRWTETLTNRIISSQSARLPLGNILDLFPVALLSGEVDG